MRKFVVDDKTQIVTNIIEVDPDNPPVIAGHSLHDAGGIEGSAGMPWDDVLKKPALPPPPPPPTPGEISAGKDARAQDLVSGDFGKALLAVAKAAGVANDEARLKTIIRAELK